MQIQNMGERGYHFVSIADGISSFLQYSVKPYVLFDNIKIYLSQIFKSFISFTVFTYNKEY